MTIACRQIIEFAPKRLPIHADQITYLAADQRMVDSLSDVMPEAAICTTETVQHAMRALAETNDTAGPQWIIFLGHAAYYNGRSQYNVMGPDFDQTQFGKWAAEGIKHQQIMWLTFPTSGFSIAPLSRPGRILVSATEADLEFTGTEMPYALANVLAGKAQKAELSDVDQDDRLTLLDLYLACNLEIHDRFLSSERLQTEHAQLDDNGDRRGSEVQEAYLPKNEPEAADGGAEPDDAAKSTEETSNKIEVPDPINDRSRDGYAARRIKLPTTNE